ncbi:hypothetical protein BU26DRAFT_500489 [Trematosphaeria pertusa]|uniref:Uncharacterized protein n=1 Tax=Trematosphaeria pertusa TaxID=390896 RepID=A0A6A6IXZ7_9PLEO|nr:uncharacterized protein BU26DRAFT_500489 [Trematosphaeria pertusa]KAF2254802.1 hypothetical protein BU26DRAFT_500489 [Trematosphaeria pertusa]
MEQRFDRGKARIERVVLDCTCGEARVVDERVRSESHRKGESADYQVTGKGGDPTCHIVVPGPPCPLVPLVERRQDNPLPADYWPQVSRKRCEAVPRYSTSGGRIFPPYICCPSSSFRLPLNHEEETVPAARSNSMQLHHLVTAAEVSQRRPRPWHEGCA